MAERERKLENNVQKAVDYLKKGLNQGYSIEQLKKSLMQYGYTRVEVEEAAGSVSVSKEAMPPERLKILKAKGKVGKAKAPKRKLAKPEKPAKNGEINIRGVKGVTSGYKLGNNIPYLETDIDKLFKWVMKRKSIPVPEAAKKFGVSESMIKDWGSILEDHELLQLHYPLFGEPVLRVKPNVSKKGKAAKKEIEEAKKEAEKQKPKRHHKVRFSKKIIIAPFLIGFFAWLLIYGFFIDTSFFLKFGVVLADWFISNPFLIITIIIIIIAFVLSVILFRRKKKHKKGVKVEAKKGLKKGVKKEVKAEAKKGAKKRGAE